jgi:hypothetical protein
VEEAKQEPKNFKLKAPGEVSKLPPVSAGGKPAPAAPAPAPAQSNLLDLLGDDFGGSGGASNNTPSTAGKPAGGGLNLMEAFEAMPVGLSANAHTGVPHEVLSTTPPARD